MGKKQKEKALESVIFANNPTELMLARLLKQISKEKKKE